MKTQPRPANLPPIPVGWTRSLRVGLRPRFAVVTVAVVVLAGAAAGCSRRGADRAPGSAGALPRRRRSEFAALNRHEPFPRHPARSLALGAAIFAGSYLVGPADLRRAQLANPADDLDWLRQEFHLSDADMARIRQLHERLPAEMRRDVRADRRQETANWTRRWRAPPMSPPPSQQKLNELGELRAQCQAQMLQHFVDVSQAMPPEQGRRYLAEMKRLTLGSHEQIEQSMSERPRP